MPILWTLIILLLAALTCVALVMHALARMLLSPPRMSDGKALYVLRRMSPGDLGLPFEPIHFDVPATKHGPAIRIAGWWIDAPANGAAPSEKTVIQIHGYADGKVGALAWTPMWRELGYNCLLIDLRAHGESGGSLCTGGVLEREDLDVVLNQLLARRAEQTREIVLFGISLGGAVALATAANRSDVNAVIADSVFADYARAATAHGKLIGAPLPSLLPQAIRWAERMAGVRFVEARPTDSVAKCACPILLIHGEVDPFVPEAQVVELGAALIARSNAKDDHWIVEDTGHVLAISADADAYRERIRAFIERSRLE